MDIAQIKHELRTFFNNSFKIKNIGDQENVFATGIVHSLFFIQLLVFIEKKFNIELQADEFEVDKLTNIEVISALVHTKLLTKIVK